MHITINHIGSSVSSVNVTAELERIPITISGPDTVEVKLALPIHDLQCYWTPELRTPSTALHWHIEAKSSAVKDFPLISFFNLENCNRGTVALDNLTDDTVISAQMNQETGCYDITVRIAVVMPPRTFYLTVDRRPIYWQQCLHDWRESLGMIKPDFPKCAWSPVFCTWYAVHAAVTQDWVEANAASAAALGFGTLIIDDGWCFEQMKRVSPETIGTWYEMIGDWNVSPVKFPDFCRHVARVQSLGLKYLLWVTPALIGTKSKILERITDGVGADSHEGAYTLNPNHHQATKEVISRIARLMEEYPLDGLKIDFLDYYRPSLASPTGCSALKVAATLAEKIRAAKADALIEFRQSYATPGMVSYATQFRAGDVPFDFLDNFTRLCQVRITMGNGIPIHSDPVFWRNDELPVNISRHMIAALAGVPMLSMDLNRLTPEARTIISYWLNFYRQHQKVLNQGNWRVRYHQSNVSYTLAEDSEERIIILNDANALTSALSDGGAERVYVLNLSNTTLSIPGAETWDGRGTHTESGRIIPGGSGSRTEIDGSIGQRGKCSWAQ